MQRECDIPIMGTIEVKCANQSCDSDDVIPVSTESVELSVNDIVMQGFRHKFECGICNEVFSLYVSLHNDESSQKNNS